MGTVTVGMLAATFLVVSGFCLYCKKPLWSLLGNIAAMFLTCGTGFMWRRMLTDSGKDPAWLGFQRYPAALILLAVLFLTACILLSVSVLELVRRSKSRDR